MVRSDEALALCVGGFGSFCEEAIGEVALFGGQSTRGDVWPKHALGDEWTLEPAGSRGGRWVLAPYKLKGMRLGSGALTGL